jgi:hypothetical protein
MPDFVKGPAYRTPFGANVYLRSTRGLRFEHYTLAAASVPTETIDTTTQKILKKGEAIAKITSGGDSGKVGPFQAGVADGRQTVANLVGLNNTFLPWQLLERDVEIAVVYVATAMQAWCFERDAAGARIALTNTTADAMRSVKGMDILFK